MLRLLLGLLLFASPAHAAFTAKAWYLFAQNLSDTAGTNHATPNGTISYSNTAAYICSPNDGTAWAVGPFTDSNYISGPSALNTALANAADITTQFYYYPVADDITNQTVLHYRAQSGFDWWIQQLSNGTIKVQWGVVAMAITYTVSANTCYYVETDMHSGNGNSSLRVYLASAIGQGANATNNWNTNITTIGTFTIGRYAPLTGYYVRGYIDDFAVGTGVPASFPETLPNATPTITETYTKSPTATCTVSQSQTWTDTETPSVTATPTATPTATETDTPVDTPTETDSPTPSVTETDTPTPSETETITETDTPTDTETATDTVTVTPTMTETPAYSPTPTRTPEGVFSPYLRNYLQLNFAPWNIR